MPQHEACIPPVTSDQEDRYPLLNLSPLQFWLRNITTLDDKNSYVGCFTLLHYLMSPVGIWVETSEFSLSPRLSSPPWAPASPSPQLAVHFQGKKKDQQVFFSPLLTESLELLQWSCTRLLRASKGHEPVPGAGTWAGRALSLALALLTFLVSSGGRKPTCVIGQFSVIWLKGRSFCCCYHWSIGIPIFYIHICIFYIYPVYIFYTYIGLCDFDISQ